MLPQYNKFLFAMCQFSENGSCWFNNTAACPYQAMLVVTIVVKINVLCNTIMIMACIVGNNIDDKEFNVTLGDFVMQI